MDELYENLENYNEETTLAELRDENKELKLKLEEYALAFEKLQKDFDTLSKEHRQLEINFSSLLKTAKAEIERKTLLITKLNIEKDQMVLNSIQNGNGAYHRRRINQTTTWDTKPTKEPGNRNENKKPSIDNKASNERINDNTPKIIVNKAVNSLPHPRSNLQTRLLDMVNSSVGDIVMSSTKAEAKENIQQNDKPRSSARIGSRRKSMPAFRMDSPRFSPEEDEVPSTGSGREITQREPATRNSSRFLVKPNIEKSSGHEPSRDLRTKLNKYESDKPKSQERYDSQKYKRNYSPDRRHHPERRGSPDRRRLSPENRKFLPDRRRVSPHKRRDSPERRKMSPDRRRFSPERRRISATKRRLSPEKRRLSPDRRRQSPNRRRSSPDRHMKGSRDHSEELRHKQEYDRHRRLVSPPREKYFIQKHQSREVQRPHEVHHPQNFDKFNSHGQDRCVMKHKMPNDYEEPSKRIRLDSHHQIDERSITEPDFSYLQHDMSCQSPEFNNLEAHPAHQIREIKLFATTELEDPRRSSNRYSLKLQADKPILTSVKSDNIDLKVIDKSGWDIVKVKMPDALLQRPDTSVLASSFLQKPVPHQLDKSHSDISIDKALETDSSPNNLLPEAQPFNPGAISERAIAATFKQQDKSPNREKEPIQKAETSDMPNILQEHSTHYNDTTDTAPQKSILTDDIVDEIYMDIDNPMSNMSESGEIYEDLDSLPFKPTENTVKEHKKCKTDSQVVEHCKDAILSDKHKNKSSPEVKCKSLTNKLTKETNTYKSKKEDIKDSQPCSNDEQKEFQNYASSKEIIGDFDMSDEETSDNIDIEIQKQTDTILPTEPASVASLTNEINTTAATSKEHKSTEPSPNSEGKINLSPQDKKTKTKKKSHKHKDTQKLPKTSSILPPHKHVKAIETCSKEQLEDSSLSIDELVKIRDNLIKGINDETTVSPAKLTKKKETKTPENKEPDPPNDKSTTQKENHNRGLEKETPMPSEKSLKKKESKTKTPPENKELISSTDKSVKKKETKTKEIKHKTKSTSANKEISVAKDEPIKDIEIKKVTPDENNPLKQRKRKQVVTSVPLSTNINKEKAKTKFTELFGDSSSLVSPEDLGLVPTVIAQDNYAAMFEDAQDATDIPAIKAAVSTNTNINSGDAPVKSQESIITNKETESNESAKAAAPTQSLLYQNLQPGIIEKDNHVKTVIISSGVQPQFISDVAESNCIPTDRSEDLHVMQCVKPSVLQGLEMQALATSTPLKLQENVQPEMDPMTHTSKDVLHGSKDTSYDKTTAINISDKTNISQVKDEPDMKIFVKRRRKVLKK